jgi:hypothetical protein
VRMWSTSSSRHVWMRPSCREVSLLKSSRAPSSVSVACWRYATKYKRRQEEIFTWATVHRPTHREILVFRMPSLEKQSWVSTSRSRKCTLAETEEYPKCKLTSWITNISFGPQW